MSKKTSQLKWKGPKKGKKSVFLKNQKIFDCEPSSATRELKKEVNMRIKSKIKTKYKKFQKVAQKKKFFLKKLRKILFLALFGRIFFLFFDICTLEELLNASGLRKYQKNEIFLKI